MSSKNISHNGNSAVKKKRRFNFIDFLIILLIVALIAVLIYAFSPWSQIKKLWASNEVILDYTVEIRGVDDEFVDLIKNGDSAINSVTKSSLGTVTAIGGIEKNTELDYTVAEDGTVQGVLSESPDKYDITVHIRATAEYEVGKGYSVNGCRVAVGEELFFRFPRYSCSGFCVALDKNS